MWIAGTSLAVLLIIWLVRANRQRPLDRKDIYRVRRFSDRVHREEVFPLE